MSQNITSYTVEPAEVTYVGQDLNRPECILPERDGTIWCSDGRGGVMRIAPDGRQTLLPSPPHAGSVTNGFAIDANGDFLIADFERDCMARLTRNGKWSTLYDQVNGRAMGKANFVLRDHVGRTWLTVSCLEPDLGKALSDPQPDGYVALLETDGPRVVADGIMGCNECRLDAAGEYMYVVETIGRHISRFRVGSDGSLNGREVFGPADLGGMPDGITFDSLGNLWGTLAARECIYALTPEGEQHIVLDAGKPDAIAALDAAAAAGKMDWDLLGACASDVAPIMTSVCFAGPDLKTVLVGSLGGTRLASFSSLIAGRPLAHW